MNPITKALDEVTFRIPKEILKVVFIDRQQQWRDVQTNVKDQIRQRVINPRVLVDCNLVGGTEMMIPLEGLRAEVTNNDYTVVYRIPKAMTGGRAITSALNVTYGSSQLTSAHGINAINQISPAMQLGASVMDAQSRMPYINSAQVQLIGENVVMVRDSIMLPDNLYLRCIVENDESLSHIQVRSYRVFSKLVELAVKAFIYNDYFIQLDEGQLRGGIQVGTFKQVVDGYADAEAMYQEHLTEKWAKVAMMNDRETMSRFMRLLIGGTR